MPEFKRNFTKGKMNKDLDERMVPNGEYRDALNIEIATSEGSDVGAVQTVKGNTAVTSLFGSNATCVGTIVKESTNKAYWLVSSPDKNTASSKTYSHTEQDDSGTVSVVHDIYSDYIMEYDEQNSETNYIAVENYKVETIISNDSHGTNADHIHVSNLGSTNDIRGVGIQPGMDIFVKGVKTSITKIEKDASPWNGWRVYTEHTSANIGFEALDNVVAGDTVTFELPYNKRALGFTYFAGEKPKKLITGLNIIDGLLFWTDGLTEPKKINIERCRYGSQHLTPGVYPNGTNLYYTLLIVNGQVPHPSNGRLSTDDSTYPSGFSYMPLTYRETTVIKKSPTTPLTLTMSNTTRADIVLDGSLNVNSNVEIPDSTNGLGTTNSDFFFTSSGERLSYGSITPSVVFPIQMDWEVGDVIEFYPEDEDAGTANDVLVTAEVYSTSNGDTFRFKIQTISTRVTKVFTTYKAKLKQKEPLFEFKFPRFAYRWKYEDGEYSTYSPFSEVAFLPDEFDYLPKKGYNLGMTNNLRYLLLSGFKPITTPLDVVEIDILYKESNSPNVYTVKTIKSPSTKIDALGTDTHNGDEGWYGKIKHLNNWVEAPKTKSTASYMVNANTFDGEVGISNGVYYYGINKDFGEANIKIGDTITFPNISSGLSAPVVVAGMQNSFNSLGEATTQISLTANGTAVAVAQGAAWHADGIDIDFYRTIAVRPAIYVDHPQGSLEVKSDMIHATLPSNQLLRPWDNVPIKALAQEITGNRVVYGNYIQNYDLLDEDNKVIKNSFNIHTSNRKNVRNNIRYNDATALRDPDNGSVINWWDPGNVIAEESRFPERSIKSLRDYQVGVVYIDEFGRQTPVQTHETGTLKLGKDAAKQYNQLVFRLRDGLDATGTTVATSPEWATHYKYYIKENSNEYYNLAMDRFYDAEDGNIWLSFPSSERNKVDEETFLILKKQHDNDFFVRQDARYKILAISNEAPLFIKIKNNSFGVATPVFPTSGQPKYQQQHVDVPATFFAANGSWEPALTARERVIRVTNATNISHWYDISKISSYGSNRRITLAKPFGTDVSFTTSDGTNSGTFASGISIELAEREIKNSAEYEGRFFVKVEKDAVLEKNILVSAPEKTYITTATVALGNLPGSTALSDSVGCRVCKAYWRDSDMGNNYHTKKFFVDAMISEGINHKESNWGGLTEHGRGLHNNGKALDIAFHWLNSDDKGTWHIGDGKDPGITQYHKDIANKLKTAGILFRWKGDTTIYRITKGTSRSIENYVEKSGSMYYRSASNHRERFDVRFEPALASPSSVKDAVGEYCTGYDPFVNWGDFDASNDYDSRTIEFLEEAINDSSYTSDNPAVWETEPKENIDVDLYNEASASLPINYEWNSYLNKFVYNTYFNSYNPVDYYNCFSFANGVESNRVRDDYNAVTIDKGPKVSTVLAEQYKQEHRKSGLIYSGIYNSTSGINNLNQFIQAEKITKDINPTYGSIQKLLSRDTDLVTLCEDRVIRVLSNKDAVYNADGNINLTSTNNVLGQATPYAGDFGISTNPESFAVDQYRAYFTDKSRGAVIRLSMDGLTPISDLGMRDWFKDSFKQHELSLIGSYDNNKKLYNLTLDTTNAPKIRVFNASSPPEDSTKTYFGVTGNSGVGLVPGSVNAQDWAPFDSASNLNFNASSIAFIDVSVYDYSNTDQSSWLDTLVSAVNAGSTYNLAIGIDAEGDYYGGGQTGENIYTVSSISAATLSASGSLYHRIYLTWDSGNVDLHAHRAYIIYYGQNENASKKAATTSPYTVSFSEDTKGWTTFKSWIQETGFSVNDKYFTFKGGELYQHHNNETRNNFYGVQYDSSVCFIFNDMPSSVKSFSSLSYEGSQSKIDIYLSDDEYYNNVAKDGWYTESITTDLETGFIPEFKNKEGKWFNYIRGNQDNTLDNFNVNQFSTQGIGTPSVVAHDSAQGPSTSKLTTQDTGDTD